MSILNVDKIQPIGGGSTITVDATDIQATSATITASSFVGSITGDVTGTTSNASGATGDFSIADKIVHTGDTNTAIRFPAADTITAETGGSERLRIDSSGRLMVGTTTPGNSSADDLTLHNSGNCGVTIRAGNTSNSYVFFADGTSSDEPYRGFISYFHNGDFFKFGTGGTEKVRIASNGQVSISSDGTTDGLLTIKGDSDQVGTPSIRLLDGSDTREVSISNTSGDFVASVHGNDNAIHGHIKMFESGIFDINNGGASGSNVNRLRITLAGEILIGGRTAKPNDINKLVVTGTSPADAYDSQLYLEGSETSGAANTGGALAFGGHDGGTARNWANIYGMKENGTGSNYAAYMSFHTRPAGGGPTERLRIASDGKTSVGAVQTTHTLGITGGSSSQLLVKGTEADIWMTSTGGSSTTWRILGSTGGSTHRFRIYDNTNGKEPFYIDGSSGSNTQHVHVNSGNLVFDASGTGIDFSATAGSPSNGGEILDDYEEGSVTLTLNANTNPANTAQNNPDRTRTATGTYTKIGRKVSVQCFWNNIHSGGGNDLSNCQLISVSGLPFTAGSSTGHSRFSSASSLYQRGIYIRWSSSSIYDNIGAMYSYVYAGATTAWLQASQSNGPGTLYQTVHNSSSHMYYTFNIEYEVD